MHRPSDQAKLLFFALLRGTVTSLATEPKAAGVCSLAVKNNLPVLSSHSNIQLRLARKADVPSIQRCNLATLPENYNSQFYVNHMRQWSDLCLVAEDTTPEEPRPFGGASFHNNFNRESNVVAYVLGKVEQRPPVAQFYQEGYNRLGLNNHHEQRDDDQERFIGHVTSLAVLPHHRRKGLAAALMKQLHYHMEESYGAGAVGLHVRKSNVAACRLYQEYGYHIDLTIPGYYQDGEDAYFMKKPLQLGEVRAPIAPPKQLLPFLGRGRILPRRPWESGPLDLRLPRDLETMASMEEHGESLTPELLRGSM